MTSSTGPARFGAHNVYENQPGPTCFFSDNLIFATLFNAGVRVYDTSDPFRPEEVAYFVPEIPDGAPSNGINDVYVDENGILYVVDRLKGGLVYPGIDRLGKARHRSLY